MRHPAKRQVLSSVVLFSGIMLAQSFSLAACPPEPSGPNQTVTTLTPCCAYIFDPYPCGIDSTRTDISNVTTPALTITPDAGDPSKVHITYVTGGMTITTYGGCFEEYCGPGPSYHMVPFRRDTVIAPTTVNFTPNYLSSAWINGDPNYVDLDKVTPEQCSVDSNWKMGNSTNISLDDQTENINLGCETLIPKPDPEPEMADLPPTMVACEANCKTGAPDPVDPYSGDYYYAESDLEIPGIIPLKVVRAYTSSQSGFIGPFGVGTYLKAYNYSIAVPLNGDGTVNTSANQQLQVDDGSGLLLPLSNGSTGGLTFTNSEEIGTAGSALVLTLDGTNHLTSAIYTTPDKTKLHFDANGRLSSLEDMHGNTITLTRDTAGKLTNVSLLGRSLTLTYSTAGLIESIEDHTGRKVKYTYSQDSELLKMINPLGKAQSYSWDNQHRIQTMVDFKSNVRFLNYYAANGMIKQQALKMGDTFPTSGIYKLSAPSASVRVITDPNGNKQTFTYNSHGLLTEFKDGLNHTDTTTYSASLFNGSPSNRYIETTDALNHTTHVDLNANNLPTTITDELSQDVEITYNTTWPNKPATIINARGKTATYTYDTAGNLTTITDANNEDTTFTYNSRGQVLTMTNPLGKTTTYTYNSAGDLLTVEDPLTHTTTMTYDSLGRMVSITDANNHTTEYDYDLENRLTFITDPNNKKIEYTYDANGNLTRIKDRMGRTTSYVYDMKERLTNIFAPGSNDLYMAYDKADRVTQIRDDLFDTQNFTYDAANRLTENKIKKSGTTQYTYTYTYDNADRLSTIGNGTNTWTYGYDVINRLTSLISPQGTVAYEYSPTNFRTKLTATGMTDVTYGYDNLDRLTSLTQGTEAYGYTYDDNSRLTALTRPNGVNTGYTYDDANRLTQIHHLKTGVLDDQYDYTYDDVGNILTSSRDGGTRTYTYDALNRLTQMDKTVAVPGEALPKKIEYTYDFNGNLTQRKDTADNNTVQTTGYTYNTANYLTQMTPPVGSSITYTYNGYGAMTGDSTGRSFTWDGLHQLTQMSAGGVTTSFSYDPLGRRTGLTQGSLSKTYFYDGLDMLSDAANTYLSGPGLDNPLRLNDGTNNRYYLSNKLGSITRLTDASGASMGHYQYRPYGSLLSSSSPLSGNPFTFTAREDDGTGLMYYRARYYDPSLQAFISQDPLGDNQRYVGGNPVRYRDPLGLWGVGGTVGGSAEVGIVAGAGATGSFGGGVFGDGLNGVGIGGYASGGSFIGGPSFGACSAGNNKYNGAIGAFAGIGGGVFVTNANKVSDLGGISNTTSVNLGVGPVKVGLQYSQGANGVGALSITVGPGGAISVSNYGTTTVTTK